MVPARRFLQGLQQRVLRGSLHRVGIANDDDSLAALERPKHRAVEHVANDVDLDERTVVRFDDDRVDVKIAADSIAGPALSAGVDRQTLGIGDRVHAVDCCRRSRGDQLLADANRAGEKQCRWDGGAGDSRGQQALDTAMADD